MIPGSAPGDAGKQDREEANKMDGIDQPPPRAPEPQTHWDPWEPGWDAHSMGISNEQLCVLHLPIDHQLPANSKGINVLEPSGHMPAARPSLSGRVVEICSQQERASGERGWTPAASATDVCPVPALFLANSYSSFKTHPSPSIPPCTPGRLL